MRQSVNIMMSPIEVLPQELLWKPGPNGPPIDAGELAVKLLPEMAYMAQQTRETEAQSYSYRKPEPFHVGSAGLLVNETVNDYLVIRSGNIKLRQPWDKWCAEMFVRDSLIQLNSDLADASRKINRNLGTYRPLLLVNVGTEDIDQIEDVTFRRTPTLHMCKDCTDYYLEEHSDLIVATLPSHLRYLEVHSNADFQARRGLAVGHAVLRREVNNADMFANWGTRIELYHKITDAYKASSTKLPAQEQIARMALTRIFADNTEDRTQINSEVRQFPTRAVHEPIVA